MKKMQKSIILNAPKEKVWEVLIEDKNIRKWYEAFSPGAYADTDWKEGSKAVFKDPSNNGLIAKVVANKPGEILSMEFTGELKNGIEIYDSPSVNAFKGGRETYRLSEKDGGTELSIEIDLDESWIESMSKMWDNALQKIKAMAE